MTDSYITLEKYGTDEVTIRKSRFIGTALPCVSEEQALAHIASVRSEHKSASHCCFAYVIGVNGGITRYTDDGEPGGTAGLPIISLIKSKSIVNCCVTVVRYFGGVLLGTGGLVRAYTEGCRIALDAAGLVRMDRTCHDLCEIEYARWDTLRHSLSTLPARADSIKYAASVSFTLLTRHADRDSVLNSLVSATDGRLTVQPGDETFEAWPVS